MSGQVWRSFLTNEKHYIPGACLIAVLQWFLGHTEHIPWFVGLSIGMCCLGSSTIGTCDLPAVTNHSSESTQTQV